MLEGGAGRKEVRWCKYSLALSQCLAECQGLAKPWDKIDSCPQEAHSQRQRDREGRGNYEHPRKEQGPGSLAWVSLVLQS